MTTRAIESKSLAASIKRTRWSFVTVAESDRRPDDIESHSMLFKAFGLKPTLARMVPETECPQPPIVRIAREQCAAWLRATGDTPSEHVRAWLGPAWKEEAQKVAGNPTRKKRSADDSRPGERQAYFRSVWLEMAKPARNQRIWKAMQQGKGAEDCPVVDVAAHKTFTFRYSDRATDLLDKEIFQKDMSAVRKADKG